MLSFGGGQDSTVILYKLIYDQRFRERYAPGDLIVVMANTGNEHLQTYNHVADMGRLCRKHKIPFFFIGLDKYTPNLWRDGLIKFYKNKNTIGSKAFPKTCTDNLKIRPIYSWLDDYVHATYHTEKVGRKAAIKEFSVRYGRIRVLLGIAKGEERRASTNEESPMVWMRNSIDKQYPLIDQGLDRQACQDFLRRIGAKVPLPSNCILCPFMSLQELLYLHRQLPDWYKLWVKLEQNKIDANLNQGDRNLGVWGRKLLPEMLQEAEEKYGHMTDDELFEYKMSHGHCVMSKY